MPSIAELINSPLDQTGCRLQMLSWLVVEDVRIVVWSSPERLLIIFSKETNAFNCQIDQQPLDQTGCRLQMLSWLVVEDVQIVVWSSPERLSIISSEETNAFNCRIDQQPPGSDRLRIANVKLAGRRRCENCCLIFTRKMPSIAESINSPLDQTGCGLQTLRSLVAAVVCWI